MAAVVAGRDPPPPSDGGAMTNDEGRRGGDINVNQNNYGRNDQARRVYVGNLSWGTAWQDLKDHMRTFGGNVIRADILTDGVGRSRGCGIVEYETPEEAAHAIEKLQDTVLDGRKIFVREDREDTYAGSVAFTRRGEGQLMSARRGQGRPSGSMPRDNNYVGQRERNNYDNNDSESVMLFVGNLSWDANPRDVEILFEPICGPVQVNIARRDNRSKGYGTVMVSRKDAEAAIQQLNRQKLLGREILIRYDKREGGGRPRY